MSRNKLFSKKTLLGFLSIGVFVLSVWYLVWYTPEFNSVALDDIPPQNMPMSSNSESSITVPVSIPIEEIRTFLNDLIPLRVSGEEVGDFFTLALGVDWNLLRGPLSLSGNENTIQGTVDARGPITIRAYAFYDTFLEMSTSERIDTTITASVSFQPRIDSDWNLQVHELQVSRIFREATINPFGIDVSIRTVMSGLFKNSDLREIIENQFGNVRSLKNDAQLIWSQLCTTVSLAPGIWLQVVPKSVRTTDPTFDETNMYINLGLDAETRVIFEEVSPHCPFQDILTIEPPRPGRIEIEIPADISYATLQSTLQEYVVGTTIGEAEGVSVRFESIEVRPHSELLLIETEVEIHLAGWFGDRGRGTLYLLAEPYLDSQGHYISLRNVRLDTSSRNSLIAIVGEIAEPVLLYAVENYKFDLRDAREELILFANDALNELSSEALYVNGEIHDIHLSNIQVGSDHVRVVSNVIGEAAVTLEMTEL